MAISYIRPDKYFDGAFEQLKSINAYAQASGIDITEEYVDHTSQNNTLDEREDVVKFFRSNQGRDLLISDIWVLSSNITDLLQMVACLLKNEMRIHVISAGVVIDQNSDVMLVLGIIDQLRQVLESREKKMIGRPKGSRSSSKFDPYLDLIIGYIRDNMSVSAMARELKVSRSSLKDYIESRELKEVAKGLVTLDVPVDAEQKVIGTIVCPHSDKIQEESEA
ncbi:recombinase family protein [Sulfurimonas sp. HSL3-7]|uniref:recombinase family protein n=1 Tax=Sulfonitrofixus jiaomeiensis TaxID=3131938 RepID=UPI0031F9B442